MSEQLNQKYPLNGEDLTFLNPKSREIIRHLRYTAFADPKGLDLISEPNLPEQGRKLRIRVDTLLSQAARQVNGQYSLHLLQEAQYVIQNGYHHPRIIEVASNHSHNLDGSEYHIWPEMLRDISKYYRRVYNLIGDPDHSTQALNIVNQAIQSSPASSSVHNLAIIESESFIRHLGGDINFARLTTAFKKVIETSPQAGGYDRLAAASWWYSREALFSGHPRSAMHGLDVLRRLPIPIKIKVAIPLKEAVSPIITQRQVRTLPNVYPRDLDIHSNQ